MSYCASGCPDDRPQTIQRYAASYRTPHSNLFSPNWKVNPHLHNFCQKFGQYAPKGCGVVADPCQSIHQSLQSLDHFSLPPMYRKGGYAPKFKSRSGNVRQGGCGGPPIGQSDGCQRIPQLPKSHRPNPSPYGDAVCGLCVGGGKELESKVQGRPCDQGQGDSEEEELPFEIYPLWTEDGCGLKERGRGRHSTGVGVARCLHPSSFRSFQSVTSLEYLNFFKMKSPGDLALYQSQLAVNNHRPPVCIPSQDPNNEELDLSQPIFINAQMLKQCQRGHFKGQTTQPSYSVSLPESITIG